jgi:hypothetical protein
MSPRATCDAERNQVCFRTLAALAPKFLVVNPQIRPRPATLASPAVTPQHLLPESFVPLRIESLARVLGRTRCTKPSRLLRAEKPTFLPPPAHSRTQAQVFPTAAGPVTITPLNHASTLIEAGGKSIYLDPTKAVKFSEYPKAELILITEFTGPHGSRFNQGSQRG